MNKRWNDRIKSLAALFLLPDSFHIVRLCVVCYLSVCIPPQADTNVALSELYESMNTLENRYPKSVVIVLGDFNLVKVTTALSKYHQHISSSTLGPQEWLRSVAERHFHPVSMTTSQLFHCLLLDCLCSSGGLPVLFLHPVSPAFT